MSSRYFASLLSKLSLGNNDHHKGTTSKDPVRENQTVDLGNSNNLKPSFLTKITQSLDRTKKKHLKFPEKVSKNLPPLPVTPPPATTTPIPSPPPRRAISHSHHSRSTCDSTSRTSGTRTGTSTVRRKPVSYARASKIAATIASHANEDYHLGQSGGRYKRLGAETSPDLKMRPRAWTEARSSHWINHEEVLVNNRMIIGSNNSDGFPRPLPVPPLKPRSFPKRTIPVK
ncbi:hypothetical protein BGZ46_000315 [Entomortierella lignicola]|nr:hypothetical protein BGZ46_000315 [Entomortierella lignicola]